MKINWGTGIVIALVAFILFILSFVYKTFTNSKYDHHFVSKEYYKDEMNYQQEIDAQNNLLNLKSDVVINTENNGLVINFPEYFKGKDVKGNIYFQRSANEKLDVKLPVKLKDNKQFISDSLLVKGVYIVKIFWETDGKKYQYKDNFYY